ncbi:RNA 3'-terminal phosphate cyclase [Halanaeroarchaeum sulfurireducens]|uniref:RNA 3'-terminal phosphate cyclase n=1 Tax=Halanaeroarchaeum sulfurireducens TaxID=1604004 RepID=A0A0N9MVR9_9EURY|nr:RNA 3'-terminal phosphate cyclase [Halanaeroarchaeum sulfurireducens]ALG82069.1 RNA 3'-terminal-phosphate cyclase [Halanaeroarchaeum sulfurireducens]
MRTVDGTAGGGQLVRTAAAMSGVTGDAIRMENVRAARDQPGLRAQHVAAIETVAALADATTEGVALGSEAFTFEPGTLSGGAHEGAIETAGSVTLAFDAALPLAARLNAPATVTMSGGTDVTWSPPFDYFRSVKLPLLRTIELRAETVLGRRGFYPSGGGLAGLSLAPSTLAPLELSDRGALESVEVHSVAATSLESASVADRQAVAAIETLEASVDAPIDVDISYADAADKGSAIVIVASFESSVAGVSALGEPGKPSEAVAQTATDRLDAFRGTDAAVDVHLGDQLVPFLALAGGKVRIPRVTDHVETHLSLVREFGFSVSLTRLDDGEALLESDGGDQGTIP